MLQCLRGQTKRRRSNVLLQRSTMQQVYKFICKLINLLEQDQLPRDSTGQYILSKAWQLYSFFTCSLTFTTGSFSFFGARRRYPRQVALFRTIHRNDISTSRCNAGRTLCHPLKRGRSGRAGRDRVKKLSEPPTELPMMLETLFLDAIHHSGDRFENVSAEGGVNRFDYFKQQRAGESKIRRARNADLSRHLFAATSVQINRDRILFSKVDRLKLSRAEKPQDRNRKSIVFRIVQRTRATLNINLPA